MVTAFARRRSWMAGLSFLSAAVAMPLLAAAPAPQTPSATDLLRTASEHFASYANKVSGVSLQEHYQLIDVTGGKMRSAIRISSDVVLVNLNGGIAALRDVYAVDTRPTRDRQPRILNLLAAPATPTVRDWNAAARFPAEGAVHFALDLILKLNEPTFALRFLAPDVQGKMKYDVNGQRKINGVATVGLRFDEPRGQDVKYVIGTRGNGRAAGRLWVDPATGAVHETELFVESAEDSATIKVKYAPHATLGFLLPVETNETCAERQAGNAIRGEDGAAGSGAGASRLSFQATAKYTNVTHTPIDLRNLRK
jgi:hypothetical protein